MARETIFLAISSAFVSTQKLNVMLNIISSLAVLAIKILCIYRLKGRCCHLPCTLCKLLTKTELSNDCTVSFDIVLLEVSEKVSTTTDHLEEASS